MSLPRPVHGGEEREATPRISEWRSDGSIVVIHDGVEHVCTAERLKNHFKLVETPLSAERRDQQFFGRQQYFLCAVAAKEEWCAGCRVWVKQDTKGVTRHASTHAPKLIGLPGLAATPRPAPVQRHPASVNTAQRGVAANGDSIRDAAVDAACLHEETSLQRLYGVSDEDDDDSSFEAAGESDDGASSADDDSDEDDDDVETCADDVVVPEDLLDSPCSVSGTYSAPGGQKRKRVRARSVRFMPACCTAVHHVNLALAPLHGRTPPPPPFHVPPFHVR